MIFLLLFVTIFTYLQLLSKVSQNLQATKPFTMLFTCERPTKFLRAIWLVENKNGGKFKHECTNDHMAFTGTSRPQNQIIVAILSHCYNFLRHVRVCQLRKQYISTTTFFTIFLLCSTAIDDFDHQIHWPIKSQEGIWYGDHMETSWQTVSWPANSVNHCWNVADR